LSRYTAHPRLPRLSSSRWRVLPASCRRRQAIWRNCAKHGILLIFDEVITGFGRLGYAFAAERYGVVPDLLCFAKGITSGAVPMGGVIARQGIYDAFMHGPEHAIELFHGYTYSAHPLACAAGLAALDLYRDEQLFERAKRLEARFADAAMTLKGLPGVLDVRTVGISAGIDLAARPGAVGERGYEAMERAFHDEDLVIRITGDTLAIAPPLIVTEAQIAEIFEKTARVIKAVA
jgi:beta-alanine--pyruvate transaminase